MNLGYDHQQNNFVRSNYQPYQYSHNYSGGNSSINGGSMVSYNNHPTNNYMGSGPSQIANNNSYLNSQGHSYVNMGNNGHSYINNNNYHINNGNIQSSGYSFSKYHQSNSYTPSYVHHNNDEQLLEDLPSDENMQKLF